MPRSNSSWVPPSTDVTIGGAPSRLELLGGRILENLAGSVASVPRDQHRVEVRSAVDDDRIRVRLGIAPQKELRGGPEFALWLVDDGQLDQGDVAAGFGRWILSIDEPASADLHFAP